MLAAPGLFVYLRLKADLDESVTAGLETRAAAVAASGQASAGAAGDAEEGFAQLVTTDGRSGLGRRRRRAFGADPGGAERAPRPARRCWSSATCPASRAPRGCSARPPDGRRSWPSGQSLDDRDETLAALVASFAVGGPIAVLLASLLGYALAAAGLRPVEAMRRRAAEVSLERDGERLPLPAARDEIRRLGRDAQRDARPAARAPSSASAASWPTPATSCARRWR